jgi:hypothetical protein
MEGGFGARGWKRKIIQRAPNTFRGRFEEHG